MHIDQAVEELTKFHAPDENGFFHISLFDQKTAQAHRELIFQPAPNDLTLESGVALWCEVIDLLFTGASERRPLTEIFLATTDQVFFMQHEDFISFVKLHISGAITPFTIQ